MMDASRHIQELDAKPAVAGTLPLHGAADSCACVGEGHGVRDTQDRATNSRRISTVAADVTCAEGVAVSAVIAPHQAARPLLKHELR